jgi:cytoskeletal protein RodZ
MGAFLLSERERQGITRSEVSSRTKITMDQLANLEAGTFTGLAPVYARGFLKSYIQVLGLDPTEIIAEYKRLSGHADSTDPRKPLLSKYNPIDLDAEEGVSLGGLFAVILAAVAVLAVLTAFNRTVHNIAAGYLPFLSPWPEDPAAEAAAPESPAPAGAAPEAGDPPAGSAQDAGIPAPAGPGVRGAQASAGGGAAAPPALLPAPASGGPAAAQAPAGPRPAAPAAGDARAEESPPAPDVPGGTLRLRALRATWAQVAVDNKPVVHVYFKAGEERSFDSQSSITLAAGDGAAVEAEWNGRPLGALGPEGPLELNFPPPRT